MMNSSKSSLLTQAKIKKAKFCRKNDMSHSSNRRASSINRKDLTFHKITQKKLFNILSDIFTKRIKTVFNKLFYEQQKSFQIRKIASFPSQLITESIRYVPNLLELLKGQDIKTQTEFKVLKFQFFQRKAHKLTNLLCRLYQRRKVLVLQILSKHVQQLNAKTNKQMMLSQLKLDMQTNTIYNDSYSPIKQNFKNFHISYLKLKIVLRDRQKSSQIDLLREKMYKGNFISLRNMQSQTKKKQYIFDSFANKLISKELYDR